MNLADTLFRRGALSRHTLTVLSLSAGLYLAGFILLLPGSFSVDGTNRVVVASAMSLDARSAGFPFVAIGSFSRAAQWMLIVLMLIGAAPGGSGGGMKVTALFHFVRGVRRSLRREASLRITGIAATWIAG